MPEQLLDRAQVGAAVEEMRGEAVAQRVGRGRSCEARGEARAREQAAERAGRQASAARVQEHGAGRVMGGTRTAWIGEVGLQRRRGVAAERRQTLLLALATHARDAALEVQVRAVEP